MLASISERLLDRTHPLRRVLLPTELGTTDVLVRGVPSLLTARGQFAQCFPWTVDGLQELLQDYVPWNPLQMILNEYTEVPVIGDFGRWWTYLHDHMHQVVHALYETDDSFSRDTQAVQWLREASPLLGVGAGAREGVFNVCKTETVPDLETADLRLSTLYLREEDPELAQLCTIDSPEVLNAHRVCTLY